MSKETELRTFSKLAKQGQLSWTALPKSVQNSTALEELLATHILRKERRGAGSIISLMDVAGLHTYLDRRFPGRHQVSGGDAFRNQKRYRDSKGAAKAGIGIVLLRGWTTIRVNGQQVDMRNITQTYGCFAAVRPHLSVDRLCLVENLDCFMKAEAVLGPDWIYAHTYGRLGQETLKGLDNSNVLHFGDWDYTGLDEYLRLKEQFPQAKLYIPDQLEDWWQRQSKPLKKGAVTTKRLRKSTDPDIQRILTLLGDTNQFLEQQAIFPHQNIKS